MSNFLTELQHNHIIGKSKFEYSFNFTTEITKNFIFPNFKVTSVKYKNNDKNKTKIFCTNHVSGKNLVVCNSFDYFV